MMGIFHLNFKNLRGQTSFVQIARVFGACTVICCIVVVLNKSLMAYTRDRLQSDKHQHVKT